MKKSILAVGIIAVLGVGTIFTSWHTGKAIESNIDNNLSKITDIANKNQDLYNLNITKSNYERNIFSTKLHLIITLLPKDKTEPNEKPLKVFDDDITIHHGPFPLSAIKNGILKPQMAWIEYEMNEETSPKLWKIAGNSSLINAHLGISYGKYLTFKLINKAITLTNNEIDSLDGQLDISKGQLSFEGDESLSCISSTAQFAKLNYALDKNNFFSMEKLNISATSNNSSNVDYKINIGNLHINTENTNELINLDSDNIENQGNYTFNINRNGNFTISSYKNDTSFQKIKIRKENTLKQELPLIQINQLSIKQNGQLNNIKMANGSLSTNINSIIFGKQNLGSGVFDFNYEGIVPKFINYPLYSNQDMPELDENTQTNMKFSIKSLNWHNEEGDINVSGDIDILGSTGSLLLEDIDQVKSIKLKIDAPFRIIAHFLAQIEKPSDTTVTSEEVNKTSKHLELMASLYANNNIPFITLKKDNVKGIFTDIDYSRDREETYINGNTMTKKEFFKNFFGYY
ncbi:hypothetical protein A9G34_01530 [Gilliamella sp. Choc4-2]|uniref:DUF945 family protein n=1 Tax=Gilliamella sp. Choc4-2 TaxID=3120237 RepID=UPI00080ED188|nr:DUF945 family protein [Gilliamella apicola]OCG45806.1 hypothetical protein A9G34_01530 [Gilliamella apicola]